MAMQGSVGASRSGDQFHYQWAARQCLGLLCKKEGLVAIAIEGPSSAEGDASTDAGNQVIDVGLYYGSEALTEADAIRYVQLKHSSRMAYSEWKASGLAKTIAGFAQRFAELQRSMGLEALCQKVSFSFLTNRPIDDNVREALADIADGVEQPRHDKLHRLLVGYANLSDDLAQRFFSCFAVEAEEPDLWEQRNLLSQDLGAYLSGPDADVPLQLLDLIIRKAASDGDQDRSIRLYDVLRAIQLTEAELTPAPSLISDSKQLLERVQESDILQTLLVASHPVVIHADGGVGKSILSARLARAMPQGSVAVLYDCFGDGTYRQPLKYRHRYRDALVQIANELAGQQLCLPLIPLSSVDPKAFMRAFVSRLQQAVNLLRARTPQASLCILIDAADNAEMAAQEHSERAFVKDLITTDMPEGVRLAFTCRTHRRESLGAPLETIHIQLESFSQAETAAHLRLAYPDVTDAEIAEFAYLTSHNPRVQALAMESGQSIGDMLKTLGPAPMTVQRAIDDLLSRAVAKLKAEAGPTEAANIHLICQGLAVLRPLVPISILAQIAGVSESAVRTFALELGRPLFVKDTSLHFLDEPAETWFRETYKPDAKGLDVFLSRLKPLAASSSYVAAALPALLLSAGRMDELIALALSDESLPERNPLERRDVELQRLMFALRACLEQGRYVAAAKLTLKVGGEAAGESRQNALIEQNTDIASVLLAPDRIEELVSRRTFGGARMGPHHAREAMLLSASRDLLPEAHSRLRMAREWLISWSTHTGARDPGDDVDDADRAEFALGFLRLRGPTEAANFLKAWRPRPLIFNATKRVAERLADLGDFACIDELAEHAGGDVWMLLGLAVEAGRVGHVLPDKALRCLIKILTDPMVKIPEEAPSWKSGIGVLDAVRSVIAQALRRFPQEGEAWANLLRLYLPEDPPRLLHSQYSPERTQLIRAYALEAALRGKRVTLMDLTPKNLRPEFESPRSYSKGQEAAELELLTGGVLNWFVLGAEIACGRVPSDLSQQIDLAVRQTSAASSRDYHRRYDLEKVAAVEWMQILREAAVVDAAYAETLLTWIGASKSLNPGALTEICRIAARTPGMSDLSLELSNRAFSELDASKEDAQSRVDDLQTLARAVFGVNKAESAAYFDRAIDIASKIGDEHLSRWTAFLELAEAAQNPARSQSRTAYKLARIAELTYVHMARDKYMDWHRLVDVLVGLCPSSSLAILSRWRDRHFGRAEELFPAAIYRLVEGRHLPETAPLVLGGTAAEWRRIEDLQTALLGVSDTDQRKRILQVGYRFLRNRSANVATWRTLKTLSDDLSVVLPDLDRLLRAAEVTEAQERASKPSASLGIPTDESEKPNWDAIFDQVDLGDVDAIQVAKRKLQDVDPPVYVGDFYRQGAKRATLTQISPYLRAIFLDDALNTYHFRDIANNLSPSSKKLQSVRSELKRQALALSLHEPQRVGRRGWGGDGPLDELYADGTVTEREIAASRIKGFLLQIDTLDADGLFHLVEPLSLMVTSDEAEEILNFGLDLLADVLEPDDGDGPWEEALAPSMSCEEALAGYLWAGLARPSVSERWQHAHCIRNGVELGWSSLLSALLTRASGNDPTPFVDRRLVFYEWHARQWLCMALARSAMTTPQGVEPFLPYLIHVASDHHVVIRHFAASALRYCHAFSALASDAALLIQDVNLSKLPPDIRTRGETGTVEHEVDDTGIQDSREKYYFGMDIGPYWFAPLGRVFGHSEKSVEQQVRKVLPARMFSGSSWSTDDQRYKRGHFQGMNTSHSHGTMPEVEDLRVYNAYHGMMLVAGQLLESCPVRQSSSEDDNAFDNWLQEQLLTRFDGHWLADRRDPRIVSTSPVKPPFGEDTWCWDVSPQDLDNQLQTDDGRSVLWGSWSTTDSRDGETVSVESAFVSQTYAAALLAALQTSPEPGRIYFPDATESSGWGDGVLHPDMQLRGWVLTHSASLRLDKYDPWACKISSPGPRPTPGILESLGLQADVIGRSWRHPEGGTLRSETWARRLGERDVQTGTRLSADSDFLCALLAGRKDDSLMVRVEIRLESNASRNADVGHTQYNWPYNRYYLIEKNGITRSL